MKIQDVKIPRVVKMTTFFKSAPASEVWQTNELAALTGICQTSLRGSRTLFPDNVFISKGSPIVLWWGSKAAIKKLRAQFSEK